MITILMHLMKLYLKRYIKSEKQQYRTKMLNQCMVMNYLWLLWLRNNWWKYYQHCNKLHINKIQDQEKEKISWDRVIRQEYLKRQLPRIRWMTKMVTWKNININDLRQNGGPKKKMAAQNKFVFFCRFF